MFITRSAVDLSNVFQRVANKIRSTASSGFNNTLLEDFIFFFFFVPVRVSVDYTLHQWRAQNFIMEKGLRLIYHFKS